MVWGWGGNTWRLWSTCGGCGCCSSEEEALKLEAERRLGEKGIDINVLDNEVLFSLVDNEINLMAQEQTPTS
jgi:hypothetical protein